ncbi:MAG: hypothetical protein WC810_22680 [Janthinobacterium sp.]
MDNTKGSQAMVWYEEVDEFNKVFVKEQYLRGFKHLDDARDWAKKKAKNIDAEFSDWIEGTL